ncbi:unnamed protein product [Amoebophrya sp. A120]|nr:unnamed protein product [Amoebophrya sp. A120]|eukprot:GSA120T00004145001.1
MGKQRPTRRKLAQFFNWRVRVQCFDRQWIGILMGVDRHFNLVLHKTEESRLYKVKGEKKLKEVKRTIGLIVLRGCEIITVTPEEPGTERHVYVRAVETKKKKEKEKLQQKISAKAGAPITAAGPRSAPNPMSGMPMLQRPNAQYPGMQPQPHTQLPPAGGYGGNASGAPVAMNMVPTGIIHVPAGGLPGMDMGHTPSMPNLMPGMNLPAHQALPASSRPANLREREKGDGKHRPAWAQHGFVPGRR